MADAAARGRAYPERMNTLHLLNAGGPFSPVLAAEVREVTQEALARFAAELDLNGVDVVLGAGPFTIPETGVVGYAPNAFRVDLTVTPDSPAFQTLWRTEVPATLAHELHHVRRWRGPGYGETLLEALVSEGLAQQFEAGYRGEPPVYAQPTMNLAALWERTAPILHGKYDHAAWFFGSAEQALPRWGGYALGYELVRRFLAREGGDAAGHADTPASAFEGAW